MSTPAGNLARKENDIKEHSWFKGVRWDMLSARMVKPPFIPKLLSDDDTSNFDDYDDVQDQDQGSKTKLTPQQQKLFKDFGPLKEF